MKHLRSEDGIGSLIAILMVAGIVAVSFGAYQTYQKYDQANQAKTDSKSTPGASTQPDKAAAKVDVSGWIRHDAPSYSIKYPGNWSKLPPLVQTQSADITVFSNRSDYTAVDDAALYLLTESRMGASVDACYKASSYAEYKFESSSAKMGSIQATKYLVSPTEATKKRYAVIYIGHKGGQCYSITMASTNQATRDASQSTAAGVAASFQAK